MPQCRSFLSLNRLAVGMLSLHGIIIIILYSLKTLIVIEILTISSLRVKNCKGC